MKTNASARIDWIPSKPDGVGQAGLLSVRCGEDEFHSMIP